jgi:hypothetical protein
MPPTIFLCVRIAKLCPLRTFFDYTVNNLFYRSAFSRMLNVFSFENFSVFKLAALQTKTNYILYMML